MTRSDQEGEGMSERPDYEVLAEGYDPTLIMRIGYDVRLSKEHAADLNELFASLRTRLASAEAERDDLRGAFTDLGVEFRRAEAVVEAARAAMDINNWSVQAQPFLDEMEEGFHIRAALSTYDKTPG